MEFLTRYLQALWGVTVDLAPWMLLGMVIAGVVHVLMPQGFIRRHLGRSSLGSVLWAVGAGVPMPLCSCGVLPTALGLKKEGASDGASAGFLISTPQTGMDSILVSASFLGWPFALFKVAAALVTGVIGGVLVNRSGPRETGERADPGLTKDAAVCDDGCGTEMASDGSSGFMRHVHSFFSYTVEDLLRSIYGWIIAGVAVAALIEVLVPPGYLATVPGLSGFWAMVAMLAISLPLYVCSTSSVPIAASLIAAGMPAGSALVFLMAGPATNSATLAAVWRSFGKRVTVIYLGVVALMSILFGLVFDFILRTRDDAIIGHTHQGDGGFALFSAVLLVMLLVYYMVDDFRRRLNRRQGPSLPDTAEENDPMKLELTVEGMTCQNCVRHVTDALKKVGGVTRVDIDLNAGLARVTGEEISTSEMVAAIRDAGYEARLN